MSTLDCLRERLDLLAQAVKEGGLGGGVAYLAERGIEDRGWGADKRSCSCPVARYLAECPEVGQFQYPDGVTLLRVHWGKEEIRMPKEVVDLVTHLDRLVRPHE